jgi:hypothetical protein
MRKLGWREGNAVTLGNVRAPLAPHSVPVLQGFVRDLKLIQEDERPL